MAPTTTKTTAPKSRAQSHTTDEGGHIELAQQFKTVKDYTTYVLARIQQANPNGPIHKPANDMDLDGTETEVRPRKEKRVKGRRRAANPVATVEASLRRQTELKSNFRNIARPLKIVLDEIGRRTTESLESDSHAHENAAEHLHVEAGLQRALEQRSALVKRGDDYQRAQLEARRRAEEEILQNCYKQFVDDAQDRFLDKSHHRILQIERQSRMADAIADQDTEDEDDVILQPHSMSYRYNRGSVLPSEYDSRSRLGLAVDQAHSHFDVRRDVHAMLDDQVAEYENGHTIMDASVRDAAVARRECVEGVDLLARATQQVEDEAQKKYHEQTTPLSLNRTHTSLMELADVATRSRNARNDMPPPETPIRRPSTATRIEHDDVFSSRHSSIGTLNTGRKRSRSGTQVLLSPFTQASPRDPSMSGIDPEIKEECPVSPGSQSGIGPRAAVPLNLPVDVTRLTEGQVLAPRPFFNGISDNRLDVQSSVLSRASLDRQSYTGKDDSFRRAYNSDRGRMDDTTTQPSPRMTLQSLASPSSYHASPSFAPGGRPRFDYESHFRPMELSHRRVLQHPPMPPTAQPINHFANSDNNNIHRNSFGNIPFPPRPAQSSWSNIPPSPLVALPHGDSPSYAQPPGPMFAGLPPFPPVLHHHHQQQHPQQHTLAPHGVTPSPLPKQYGGPTLAPQAAGPFHTPQPAFAQQMGRQEQSRRRNTEGAFPRFREYRGPG